MERHESTFVPSGMAESKRVVKSVHKWAHKGPIKHNQDLMVKIFHTTYL